MSKTTQLLFTYILDHPDVSVAQISEALHLTRADIRHHLKELLQTGQVCKAGKKSPDHAGRPSDVFRAATPLIRAWIDPLFHGLYQVLYHHNVSDETITLELVNWLLKDFKPEGTATSKLNQAVRYLGDLGISSRWIAGPEGPVIYISPNDYLSTSMIEAIKLYIAREL